MRHLRWIRAAVALAFLAPAVLAFLDFGRLLPPGIAPNLARLQLVPAILRLPAIGAAVIVVALAGITLLGGRIYCSTICPLGTLQDLLIRLGDRLHRRGRYRFRFLRSRAALHLSVAAAAFALAIAGSLLALDQLEPWSGFGRMLSTLVRPPVAAAVNGLSRALAAHHVYAIHPVVFPAFTWGAAAVSFVWLAGIAALALARGRLFCNLLCPAGAVLRLLSRRTAFRIAIDGPACNGCGICEKACKGGCIDAAGRKVEFDACVGCFVCLDVCPRDGVRIEPAWRRTKRTAVASAEAPADPGRRAALRLAAVAPAALLLLPPRANASAGAGGGACPGPPAGPDSERGFAARFGSRASGGIGGARSLCPPVEIDPRDARAPITPPGSLDRRHFSSRCTACQLCVAVCPTQVLRPSLVEYDLSGLLQPRLVYDGGACVYDCNRCGEVCPTNAILGLPLPAKQLVQVGRARFVKADCVVETKKKVCGACAEHCPTKAIAMVPYPGGPGLRIPELDEALCIGCGACEHPCPVQPRKAIYVEALSPHGKAKRREELPLEKPVETGEFPF